MKILLSTHLSKEATTTLLLQDQLLHMEKGQQATWVDLQIQSLVKHLEV